MKFFGLLLALVPLAWASSFPDSVGSCDAEDPAYGSDGTIMDWTDPARFAGEWFTLRAGDSCNTPDATTYTPGEVTILHLRTLRHRFQFRGLLLYAETADGTRVGDWEITTPNDDAFWISTSPSCQGKSLMHKNAGVKMYHHQFPWRAPPTAVGPITFKCLIKRGEANLGEFFWPNDQHLQLTPNSAPRSLTWVKGTAGQTCSQVCSAAGSTCNDDISNNLGTYGQGIELDTRPYFSCNWPAYSTDEGVCGVPAHVDDSNNCFFPVKGCAPATGVCNAAAPGGLAPLCPCGTLPANVEPVHEKDPDTYCGVNPCEVTLTCSAPHRASSSLATAVIALGALSLAPNNAVRSLGLAAILAMALPSANAHNWVISPSRSRGEASTYKPCRPVLNSSIPHFKIGQGDTFEMEWATGHNHIFYFTVVAREDIEMLKNTSARDLEEYLEDAESLTADDLDVFKYTGPQWEKQHINRGNDHNGIFDGDNITESHPDFITRHPRYGTTGGRNYQWKYKPDLEEPDRRVSYYNAKFPHIIAVHAFKQVPTVDSRAGDRDIARITINLPRDHATAAAARPAGAGAGKFLVQYLWRGYFDCIDVDLHPRAIPYNERYGRPANETAGDVVWRKIDHCQFQEARRLQSDCMEVITNPERCQSLCTATTCDGINVVPLYNPVNVFRAFVDKVEIPWGADRRRCSRSMFANSPDGTHVCYAVQARAANNTMPIYTVSEDPEDPVFYSTCYIKQSEYVFDELLPGYVVESGDDSKEKKWGYQDQCISCADWGHAQASENVPMWATTDICRPCEESDVVVKPSSVSVLAPLGRCDGQGRNSDDEVDWRQRDDSLTTSCAAWEQCTKTVRIVLTSTRNGGMTQDECIAAARLDPECDSVVMTEEGASSCKCWIKSECCGECSIIDEYGDDWNRQVLFIGEETADPTCASGTQSADGRYCCSSSCSSCPSMADYQITFMDNNLPASDVPFGWTAQGGDEKGTNQYGWNCDMRSATTSPRDDEDTSRTIYNTGIELNGCNSADSVFTIDVPNGQYRVEVLVHEYDETINSAGCKVNGETIDGRNSDDNVWIHTDVAVTGGEIRFAGERGSNCGYVNAIRIFANPSTTELRCEAQNGQCCPHLIEMENRPCSAFGAPCDLDPPAAPTPAPAPTPEPTATTTNSPSSA